MRNTKKLYQIPWSFIEQHEALRNTKTELHVYQVKRSLEYQEALTTNCCNFVSRFCKTMNVPRSTKMTPRCKRRYLQKILDRFGLPLRPHFRSKKLSHAAKKRIRNRCPKMKKSHVNQAKAVRKFHQMVPKRYSEITQSAPKRYPIDA